MGNCCDSSAEENMLRREEDDVEGNVDYNIKDPRFLEIPKWPLILLDATGSMNSSVAPNSQLSRAELVYQSINRIVGLMAPVDDAEDKWDLKDGIGTPIITFNAIDGGVYRGLLHPNNLDKEFANIAFRGATHIMDGWRKMFDQYEAKFRDLPRTSWPLLLCLLITDGEIQDAEEFERHLARVRGRVFVEIAVVGHGPDHDKALDHYARISKTHPHVRATQFTSTVDAAAVASQLLSLVNLDQCKKPLKNPAVPVPATNVLPPPPAYMQAGENDLQAPLIYSTAPEYQP